GTIRRRTGGDHLAPAACRRPRRRYRGARRLLRPPFDHPPMPTPDVRPAVGASRRPAGHSGDRRRRERFVLILGRKQRRGWPAACRYDLAAVTHVARKATVGLFVCTFIASSCAGPGTPTA